MTEALTDAQIASLVRKYWTDLPDSDLATVVAIAKAESGGRPDAKNVNRNGTRDWGLFQVNDVNWNGQSEAVRLDPDANTKAAYVVYKRQGLKAWSAYNAGKHTSFIDGAADAIKKAGILSAVAGVTAISGTEKASTLATLNPGEAIAGAFASLNTTLARFFNNFALWIVAVVLVILGLLIVSRRQVGNVVGMAGPGKVTKAVSVAKAVTK